MVVAQNLSPLGLRVFTGPLTQVQGKSDLDTRFATKIPRRSWRGKTGRTPIDLRGYAFVAAVKTSTKRAAMILSSPYLSCQTGNPKMWGSRGGGWSLKESAGGGLGSRPRMPLAPGPLLPKPLGRG